MTAARVPANTANWLSSMRLESGSLMWILFVLVAAGALLWALGWSRMKPLYHPRAPFRHHLRRARQKELRPR